MKDVMRFQHKRGSAIMITILLTAALGLALAGVMRHSMTERRLNVRHALRLEAKNAAEAVVEYGFAQMRHHFDTNTNVSASAFDPSGASALAPPSVSLLGPHIEGSSLELIGGAVPPLTTTLTYIDPTNPDNEFDPLKGTNTRIRSIVVLGKATVTPANGSASITSYAFQEFQVRDSFLFEHAIFYNLDLDLHPGPVMDIYGPVHTNNKLRLNAYRDLTFHDKVTTTDHLYHQYEHQASKYWDDIYFMDRDNNPQSMKVGGTFMDSTMGAGYGQAVDDAFRSFASNRWHGNLQTKMHGVPRYNPVGFGDYEPDDPTTPSVHDPNNAAHPLIEPSLAESHPDYDAKLENEKIANKAGLYLKWNTTSSTLTAYDADGNALDISSLEGSLWTHRGNTPTSSAPNGTIFDRRRGQHIKTMDIHTGKLKQLIENPNTSDPAQHISGYDPNTDWNGIVYLESYSSAGNAHLDYTGVRLVGGETDVSGEGIPSIGADPGLTIATNNVVYVQGHFNADGNTSSDSSYQYEANEVPMAVMADAVTFLSDAHSDYSMYTTNEPNAVTTEVSMAVVSGIRPPNVLNDGTRSGGAHNFPRFLESWSNDTFYIRGSMVCLYECEVDWSDWSTAYYNPPNRGYGFNKLFEEGVYPPGTPLIRTYRRKDFQELSKSDYEAAKAQLPWSGI